MAFEAAKSIYYLYGLQSKMQAKQGTTCVCVGLDRRQYLKQFLRKKLSVTLQTDKSCHVIIYTAPSNIYIF